MVNPNTSTANISVPLLDKSQGASHTRGLPRCVADLDWVGHGFGFDYPVLFLFFNLSELFFVQSNVYLLRFFYWCKFVYK